MSYRLADARMLLVTGKGGEGKSADGVTASWQKLQHGFWHAGCVQQLDRARGDQAGRFSRFCQYAVDSSQGGSDLASKISQRKFLR